MDPGSRTAPMNLTSPPQVKHLVMSNLKVRLRRLAHVDFFETPTGKSSGNQKRSGMGKDNTNCRYGTIGSTLSTRWATDSAIRLPQQLGQKPLFLQLNIYEPRLSEETVLYKVLAEHIETFIAQRELDGKGLPEFVVKELWGFLLCGVLQYGFLRTKCKACDFERAVPLSCKGRDFCPSCCGKGMAEKAYHLIDNVLPDTPYRQWVLSLRIPLRFWMAMNEELTSKVHQVYAWKFNDFLITDFERPELATIGKCRSVNVAAYTVITYADALPMERVPGGN
jgi:hypothetical protein